MYSLINQRLEQLEKEVRELRFKSLPAMKDLKCSAPHRSPYPYSHVENPYKCQYSNYYNREHGWLCPAHTELQNQIKELTPTKL